MDNTINFCDYILTVLKLSERDIENVTIYTRNDMHSSINGTLQATAKSYNDDCYTEMSFRDSNISICFGGYNKITGEDSSFLDDAKSLCGKISLDTWNNSNLRQYIDSNF